MLPDRLRRFVLLVAMPAVTALSLIIPAHSSGRSSPISKVVVYITTYTGHYSFIEARKSFDYALRETDITQNQQYTWQEVVRDIIVPHRNGKITESRSTTVDADGDYDETVTGSQPSSTHCDYSSQPKRQFNSKVFGNPDGLQPVSGNPLIPYDWTLPDHAGVLGVNSSCASSGEVLLETPDNSGTVGVVLEHTPAFDKAFSGSDSVHFKAMPARHPVDVTLANRAPLPNGGYDQAQVTIGGGIEFERWGDPRNNHKVANLLLNDLLDALGAKASGDDSPIAIGDNDTVLVPGMVPGTVTLGVTGTITWSSGPARDHRAKPAATTPTLLYTGKARITNSNTVVMQVSPTAAGRAALSETHPGTSVQLRATFRPAGRGAATTVTRSGTIGANG